MGLLCYHYQVPKAFLSMVGITSGSFQSAEACVHVVHLVSTVTGYDVYLPFLCLDILQLLVLA